MPAAQSVPAMLLLSTLGTYSLQNPTFDLSVVLTFGVVGYVMRRAGYRARGPGGYDEVSARQEPERVIYGRKL